MRGIWLIYSAYIVIQNKKALSPLVIGNHATHCIYSKKLIVSFYVNDIFINENQCLFLVDQQLTVI
jgi:hypothetical protein